MSRTEVMTPLHPRWNTFIEALSHSLICARTTENARRLLMEIDDVDIDQSLDALRRLGGRCDCEIVFDVGHVPEPNYA